MSPKELGLGRRRHIFSCYAVAVQLHDIYSQRVTGMATNGHIQPATPHAWRNQSITNKCEWPAETTNAVGTYIVAECVSPHSNGMDVDMEISYLRFLAP